VLVSPSTVIWLLDQLPDSAFAAKEGETAASQVTNASIVAMLG